MINRLGGAVRVLFRPILTTSILLGILIGTEEGSVGDTFQALAEWLSHYGYPVLFLIVFAENAGVPLPGETAVLVAGLLAGRPDPPLAIVWVIVVVFLAAVLGDNLGFWLGRRLARRRLEQGKRFLFLTPATLQSVEGYFEHYGLLTIFFARFVTGLRVVAALAAGTSRMTWPHFVLANAGGALAWAGSMSLLGYFFGQSWELLHKWLGRGALIILGSVVLLVGVPYLWRHLRRLPTASWDRLLRLEVWLGFLAAVLIVVCMALLLVLAERHPEPSSEDTAVRQWVEAREGPGLNALATVGSYLGSLPVLALVALLAIVWLGNGGRPWQESAALVLALLASEGLGLLLLALIRHRGIEPERALTWPFGFAGLETLRAAAVYGMLAHILWRHNAQHGPSAWAMAIALILLVGFSVVWSHAQLLSEVLVESVTGSLILFFAFWWLEGYGFGPHLGPPKKTD